MIRLFRTLVLSRFQATALFADSGRSRSCDPGMVVGCWRKPRLLCHGTGAVDFPGEEENELIEKSLAEGQCEARRRCLTDFEERSVE